MIHVVWFGGRGYWDEGFLEAFFANQLWRTNLTFTHHASPDTIPPTHGAIVVVAGRWHADRLPEIQSVIDALPWCLLIVTGDEERTFDWTKLHHPRLRVWVQTPHPDRDIGAHPVGDFWPPSCQSILADIPDAPRTLDWFFAGQVNNISREACAAVLNNLPGGQRLLTDVFGSGLAYPEYLAKMASAKVIPCPSGPFTVDTFRLYEALEAGCVPVVERASPNWGDYGYWPFLFDVDEGDPFPFPVIDTWGQFPAVLASILADWPAESNRVQSWWRRYKRYTAHCLHDDLIDLGAPSPPPTVADLVTVIITTSPIVSHPSTAILDATIASIRQYPDLADAEIILAADGVRAEQQDLTPTYNEYLRRSLVSYPYNVEPFFSVAHLHQSLLTASALHHVRTPLILFVEHDTPLVGEIPWLSLVPIIQSGEANLIRFYHEPAVHPEHRHLMSDDAPTLLNEVLLLRTIQWSQRPHLASTDYYHRILADNFAPGEHYMIEDRLHSVVQSQLWDRNRLWLYAPDGDMKRSEHLDGRQGAPKWVDS